MTVLFRCQEKFIKKQKNIIIFSNTLPFSKKLWYNKMNFYEFVGVLIVKLLVLDGNSIINRAFYGIRPLTTKDGIFTNGIFGFLNILLKLKEQVQPDGIVVAFDLRAPTFRHKMYEEYKAGRKSMPEELAMQMPLLKELLPAFGVTVLEQEGYEADDLLGTLARMCEKDGYDCVLATGDRDSLQLVNHHTHVLLAATKQGQPVLTEYTPELIQEEKGITPIQLIDVKALMGDSSDNIPGVAGIGEKTALALIQSFKTLQGVYDNIEDPAIKAGVRAKLQADKENAFLSYQLGEIDCTVPLDFSVSSLFEKTMNPAELSQKLARLELFKMIERLQLQAVPVQESTKETVVKIVSYQGVVEEFACTENDSIFIFSSSESYYFAMNQKVYGCSKELLQTITSSGAAIYAHDLKGWYHDGFVIANPAFDTMLAAYLLNPSASDYSLSRLISEYSVSASVEGEVEDNQREAIATVACLEDLCKILHQRLEADGQLSLLTDMEIPLAYVLYDMEITGFLVDWEALKSYGDVLEERIQGLMQSIYELVGYEFNLNSPKQLGEALFVKLGLPAKKKTKSGFSTSAEVLEELKNYHPAVEQLLEYRQLAKLKSTYVDGLLAVRGEDGRVHTTFNQAETRTGRISSSEPNLQNIPVRRENGRELRRFFIAPQGDLLCDADYSQIELRVLAHMADDQAMIETFANGGDIHTSTAARVFHMPEQMVTPLMRSQAKAVNFGIVYGIGPYSLSNDLNISFKEAKDYINGYMATYSGVSRYMSQVVEQAKEDGYATTLLGRRRYLPELKASNAVTRGFGERVARNMPVQGTSADIIKIAMIRVFHALKDQGLKAKLILQVHDELIVETPKEEQQIVLAILKQEMEQAVLLKVPMEVDAHVGETWYDAKG